MFEVLGQRFLLSVTTGNAVLSVETFLLVLVFFFFSPSLLGSGQVDVFQGFFLMFFVFLFSKVERVEVIPRSNSTMKL